MDCAVNETLIGRGYRGERVSEGLRGQRIIHFAADPATEPNIL